MSSIFGFQQMAKKLGGNATSINSKILDYIIGSPPGPVMYQSQAPFDNSLQTITIVPCLPRFGDGYTIFKLDPAYDTAPDGEKSYKDCLNDLGYSLGKTIHSKGLVLCVQSEGFATESFSNEYGESFLNSLANVASDGLSQIVQMSGKKDVLSTMGDLATQLEKSNMPGAGMAKSAKDYIGQAQTFIKDISDKKGMLGDFARVGNALIGGARIDFPFVWKGSGFSPSYSFTINLYNPYPGDDYSNEKFIVGPLAAILLLAVPRPNGPELKTAFNYPFTCKVYADGLFNLKAAGITNISVTKGGNTNDIAYTKRPGSVTVRIDFQSLYANMIGSNDEDDDCPTLGKYLKNLREKGNVKPMNQKSIGSGVFIDDSDLSLKDVLNIPTLPPMMELPTRIPDSMKLKIPKDFSGLTTGDVKKPSVLESITGSINKIKSKTMTALTTLNILNQMGVNTGPLANGMMMFMSGTNGFNSALNLGSGFKNSLTGILNGGGGGLSSILQGSLNGNLSGLNSLLGPMAMLNSNFSSFTNFSNPVSMLNGFSFNSIGSSFSQVANSLTPAGNSYISAGKTAKFDQSESDSANAYLDLLKKDLNNSNNDLKGRISEGILG